jgi:hypothetical protein
MPEDNLKHGKAAAGISRIVQAAGMAATIGVFAGVAGHAAFGAAQGTAEEAAQRQWEVKRADWGAEQQRTDVTLRLRQVLFTNADGELRVDSVTLGFDPAPGQEKTLRILAENAAGEQRNLSFKDGATLDPRDFDTGAATVSARRTGGNSSLVPRDCKSWRRFMDRAANITTSRASCRVWCRTAYGRRSRHW